MSISSEVTLTGNQSMTLLAGDIATSTTVNNGASLLISSGGYAQETIISDNRFRASKTAIKIYDGGIASDTVLSNNGTAFIYSGGIMDDANVVRTGILKVAVGGTATNLEISSGIVSATVGGDNNDTVMGGVFVTDNNTSNEFSLANNIASNFFLYTGAAVTVSKNGIVKDINVNNSATLIITSGASATGVVHNGGIISYSPIHAGDTQTLVSGTNSNGSFLVSGGVASGMILYHNCVATISSGGVAYDTVTNGPLATLQLFASASASRTTVSRGILEVFSGGTATDTVVSGTISAYTGATVENTVLSGGKLYTSLPLGDNDGDNQGTENPKTTIRNLTVNDTASLFVDDPALLDGTISIAGKAEFSTTAIINSGATLNLDISSRDSTDTAIINDFSKIGGSDFCITVSVENTEQYGSYKLATSAADFAHSITIVCGNSEVVTLSVGDYKVTEGQTATSYSLSVDDTETLVLGIGNVEIPILNGTPETDIKGYSYTISWNSATSSNGIAEYILELNDSEITITSGTSYTCANATIGEHSYRIKAIDIYGNESVWTEEQNFSISNITPQNVVLGDSGASWDQSPNVDGYVAQLSGNSFSTTITIGTESNGIDLYNLGTGHYDIAVRADIDSTYSEVSGKDLTENAETGGVIFESNANGMMDVFFAQTDGVWGTAYSICHVGTEKWSGGTGEKVSLRKKNRIANIFYGSEIDSALILLSDSDNGDALVLDDIFTEVLNSESNIARFSAIDEIQAGAGGDLLDLTSTQFSAPGVIIRGGDGNDTIWSGDGANYLFGDAGNDRLVGGADNDIICGGSGNDKMHGGGGDDTFTFAGNWGSDIVENLSDGNITLWFADLSLDDIDLSLSGRHTVISDGTNTVKVLNVHLEESDLRFGGNYDTFAELESLGAFAETSSDKIEKDFAGLTQLASI